MYNLCIDIISKQYIAYLIYVNMNLIIVPYIEISFFKTGVQVVEKFKFDKSQRNRFQ